MTKAANGLVRYRAPSGWRTGAHVDGRVIDLGPESPRALLAGDPAFVENAVRRGGQGPALADVELGPPVPDPEKIICIGQNYLEHVGEMGREAPVAPNIFAKFANCLVGSGQPIVLCAVSHKPDYEGELAVVIGRACRNVRESDALSYVAGYTVMNDVSARDLQRQTSQFTAGKAPDTYGPLGPVLAPASAVPDPQALTIETRLNGEVMQHASTAGMIFPVAHTIAWLSSILTLSPGDVIATGTPAGVGAARQPPVWLKPGDVVEVEIERIGVLSNPVAPPFS